MRNNCNDENRFPCPPRMLYAVGQVGPTGPTGPAGAATVTVGTTTTGAPGTEASVVNSGDNVNVVLDFTIPQGATGPTGPAPNLIIGTVTTGAPGTDASVTIRNT